MIPFVKTQALGNDFLLVRQEAALPEDLPSLARRMCHRQFGIGADGLIVWHAADSHYPLRIFNQDGSEAECSGNGLRCLAAYLIETGISASPQVVLETVSGQYALQRIGGRYTADMGVPALDPPSIPMRGESLPAIVVDYPLIVDGETVRITACSTGNPHCSIFVNSIEPALVRTLGPRIEHHPAFPNRTNVEFIKVRDRNHIDVAFWERGVGVTFASGTGSCGATVACILNGKTDRRVTVHTEAGSLDVEWPDKGRLKLTATAAIVAEGRYFDTTS